jgi:hypothetical protein
MKRLAPVLLLLLLSACGGPEGGETPEEAAEQFIRALQSGSQSRIYKSIVRSEAESFQKTDDRLDYNRWDDCNIEEFKIVGKELDGNRYRVTVLVTREIDDKDVEGEELVVCVEEQKRWKVSMSSSSKAFIPGSKRRK